MNPRKNLSPELADIQRRLGAARGKRYWRTLEELADTPAFQELMRREFPEQAAAWPDGLSRRRFLTLMGASLALAGLSGCSIRPAPAGKIVPYVQAPEEAIPGKPLFYATAMPLGGAAAGLLVESHLGRPTKVEGNPDHPGSLGATDVFAQAAVLTLYDPDRSPNVTHLGQTSTWDAVLGELPVGDRPSLGAALNRQRERRGAGLRVLTETVVSPTLGDQLTRMLGADVFPEARWHRFDPLGREAARAAARAAFGEDVNTYYDFTRANVVVALDANFLGCGPASNRYVADFMSRRRVRTTAADAKKAAMNRLYAVETEVTNTGAKADHRLALRARDVEPFARALARRVAERLGGPGGELRRALGGEPEPDERELAGTHARWIDALAEDLTRDGNRGHGVVLAGDRQPAAVHLLAHALNQYLENVGRTVLYTAPVEAGPLDKAGTLEELVHDIDRGRVEVLLILGCNPAYAAPADLRFAEHLMRKRRVNGRQVDLVPLRVHLGLYQDETARLCHWHLPEAHFLESWGDARAYDGTASVIQPLIEPLYNGRSAYEVLSFVNRQEERIGDEIVRAYWSRNWTRPGGSAQSFDDFWQRSLHDGVIAGTKLPTRQASLRQGWEKHLAEPRGRGGPGGPDRGLEVVFAPDPTLYDGRFANNGWLQECPKPLTRLTWDNAALMSPATARELGVLDQKDNRRGGPHGGTWTDLVELTLGGRRVTAPVWVMPGHADRSVTVHLGHGRTAAGKAGSGTGFNAYALRTTDHPGFSSGLEARRTGKRYLLACVQNHHLMENRHVVRAATLDHYHHQPDFPARVEEHHEAEETRVARKPLTMYEGREPYLTETQRWGMVIDLTACVGCQACVVACQAENNIPVVGKTEVTHGREMHWLRVDLYYGGGPADADSPGEFYFQPVPCMHCENAPCEYVCPVEATVHSAEGLNDMVYNRCVGTRFCQNNCPYKVRRFNFFAYADYATESTKLLYNPDVTVRSRGVMEKCTYCVQRIRHAEINAEREGRPVRDGEVLTACQAACPAEAIVFGDLSDRASKVHRWHASPLNYGLLADLNTNPRTTYLGGLRNPNPKLEKA